MRHKTQDIAREILIMFEKHQLSPEEAMTTMAMVLRQLGEIFKIGPEETMAAMHEALVMLIKQSEGNRGKTELWTPGDVQ